MTVSDLNDGNCAVTSASLTKVCSPLNLVFSSPLPGSSDSNCSLNSDIHIPSDYTVDDHCRSYHNSNDSVTNSPCITVHGSSHSVESRTSYSGTNSSSCITNDLSSPMYSSSSVYRDIIKTKGLKMLHLNVQSLVPKLDELQHIAHELNLDCISINESWLNSSFTDAEISIPNYCLFRKDRTTGPHGGVVLYVKSSMCPSIITHVFLTECVWVKVKCNSVLTIIGSIYRVPNSPVSYYENILHDLDLIFSHGHDMIVMGDFNYDTLKHDQVIKVQNIERSYLLTQIINEPTRVTPLSSTTIDHI